MNISSRLMFAKDLFFNTFHFRGHLEAVIFEQNQMISCTEIWEKSVPTWESSQCKHPRAGYAWHVHEKQSVSVAELGEVQKLRGCLIWVLKGE